jgi:signal transduction histidine kinase
VFTRPFALKLLAPTVLVSLALVGASIFGAFYLNRLHVNVSEELSENVRSTRAASNLENTVKELRDLLRDRMSDASALLEPVQRKNQEAREFLADARNLANLERERDLVGQIDEGFQRYLQSWDQRMHLPPAEAKHLDARLAEELEQDVRVRCDELRRYNAGQIERSDRDNQAIVQQLRWGLLAVGLGAPFSGLLLGYAMARSLRHSIYQLSVGIRDAAGRLNRELGSVTLDEEGDLPRLHEQMQGVIAEIERVVEQLQQREREVLRAEQLAAVGQVAAGVAHELRNPLTSVKMLVQTGLEGQPASGLPAEDLGVIEHEVRRMEQCIQMFLDFARPPRSERRQTDLIGVLRRSLALVEGRARRQKVTLVAELPTEPCCCLLDPEQIHQVVVNLLLNSLDALPRGGTIVLEVVRHAPSQEVANDVGGGRIAVRVRDTGPGIVPRIRSRLFQPFVSSKETGVGLGLSICKRILEAHGGTIQGENEPEGGAVFTFTLPA